MSEEVDSKMGGDSPKVERAQAINDLGHATIDSNATEERASKRLKMEDSAASLAAPVSDKATLGEKLPEVLSGEGKTDQTQGENGQNGESKTDSKPAHVDGRVKGLAQVKKEYLIDMSNQKDSTSIEANDDDAAENRGPTDQGESQRGDRNSRKGDKKDKKKNRGQNTERSFGKFDDAIRLCNSRAFYPEFSPRECTFGDRCKLCHDLRKYLDEGRRGDVETLGGQCPVFEQYGKCPSGWKCRFVKSHMKEIEHEDGRKEFVLIDNSAEDGKDLGPKDEPSEEQRPGVSNIVDMIKKIDLNRKRVDFTRSDEYIKWMNQEARANEEFQNRRKAQSTEGIEDLRARYVDPPFKPSEKRRLYFGPETPTLAPLTTQGNLPFRRLCVELGAQLTYSEMAMGLPLVQGTRADWTLLKVHDSELTPPKFNPGSVPVFDNYNHKQDIKFGAQISGSNYWVVTKSADILNRYCPHLRLIDLNCGCPIDMVFKSGGGSALLDNQGKMERMIRGMNATSGEVPITAKIRTGVRNNRPTATQLIGRLAFGSREHRERLGAPGCAALTLHGRSREQRYTKKADWGYIGECAALIKTYNDQKNALTDTVAEPDASTLPNAKDGRMYFLGNGDCYSHIEYYENIEKARVDTVMIGRGALIKPWLFEEIEKGQYLDKSSSERLTYIEKFVRYGLEAWGSDELGIGFTRRFLLEWLSFTHRYVPIGLLEHLPPSLGDRPPAYKGRDDMETLMASGNFKDWIKISEMFLGPVHPTFKFQPKHKSNSYEAEG
ncbi:tRNA-dihydrouridine(47) synthase [NAD(P)(+)] [Neonectria ditissima]|uniref:tRNA-dihydrouridine(47) synthase [NAD(P)(+)] n=1 Tax=Neonectria ditissima TaxID=78410 RepID=A0A0P7B2R8_9HYPO|nr:tRNA-dihydrouridine(47) synthase [NAD(P)(+)] [Neonectria ditissima]